MEQLEQFAPNNQACKRAVIVGGGLIGIELAEMLLSRNIPVTFLVREKSFWNEVLPYQESEMINRHIREHNVDLRLNTQLKEIKANGEGQVSSVIIEETREEILCDLVGLTTGVSPNIDFVKNSNIMTNTGILVNRFLETNIPNVYAIGDCAEQKEPLGERKAIEAVWYTGRMMGETLAQTICKKRMAYSPEHWFNSAKFFDIRVGVALSFNIEAFTSSSSTFDGSTSQTILFLSKIFFLTPLLEANIIFIYFFLFHKF